LVYIVKLQFQQERALSSDIERSEKGLPDVCLEQSEENNIVCSQYQKENSEK